MTTVKSDQSQRDGQFQGRIMDTSTYPTATFILTQPIQLGSLPADGVTVTARRHGQADPARHDQDGHLSRSRPAGPEAPSPSSGTIPITFADYGIDNPSGGPATTASSGSLEFLLNFSK